MSIYGLIQCHLQIIYDPTWSISHHIFFNFLPSLSDISVGRKTIRTSRMKVRGWLPIDSAQFQWIGVFTKNSLCFHCWNLKFLPRRDLINVTGYYKVRNNRPGKLTSSQGIKAGKSSFIKENQYKLPLW